MREKMWVYRADKMQDLTNIKLNQKNPHFFPPEGGSHVAQAGLKLSM